MGRRRDGWLLLALIATGCVAAGGSIWASVTYGGDAFWPGLFGNFAATLAAFILALWWERSRELRQVLKEAEAGRARTESEAKDLQDRRVTEARRRLEPVRAELLRNEKSLKSLEKELRTGAVQVLHPELLEGAWVANAPRLAELIADYGLISDLAATYGRIEELRWRLRMRTETFAGSAGSSIARQLADDLATITRPLVEELHVEVTTLLDHLDSQIESPDVEPVGLVHTVTLSGSLAPRGTLTLRRITSSAE